MPYTLGQAAKATGKSKSTLQAAIKKGRISAIQDDLGQYQIDPAELHRVYPPISPTNRPTEPQSERDRTPRTGEDLAEIRALQARLEVMEELVRELRGDKEKAEKREANLWRDVDHWKAMTHEAQQRLKALEAPKPEPMGGEIIEGEMGAVFPAPEVTTPPTKKGSMGWLGWLWPWSLVA